MPLGNRLSDMDYDEVSLVDAGACNDDVEGAHVLLMKRDTKIRPDEVVDFGKAVGYADGPGSASTKSTKQKSSSKKKKGTTQRAQNWNESRHPRVKSGPGGGEFSSTSAASKKKYGKGGTAIDNLPAGDKTTNSTAAKLGLEHGITAAQKASLSSVGSDKGGTGATAAQKKAATAAKTAARKKAAAAKKAASAKKTAAKKKQTAAKKKQTAVQRKLRQQVSLINGLAQNQREAYRKSGKPIPKGYEWNSNDRLVNVGTQNAKTKLAQSLGLPAASSSSSTKKQLVMTSSGQLVWKSEKRGVVDTSKQLNRWLYGEERSAAS